MSAPSVPVAAPAAAAPATSAGGAAPSTFPAPPPSHTATAVPQPSPSTGEGAARVSGAMQRGGFPSSSSAHNAASLSAAAPRLPASSVPGAANTTATTTTTSFASSKNNATQRKVSKLLDITTSSDIKDLASYVDGILPGYFYTVETDSQRQKGDGEAASTSSASGSPPTTGSAKAISSATLRAALDQRGIDMHKSFLNEFAAVYESFQRVAAKVDELQDKCTSLEGVLSSSTGGSASTADEFFYQMQMHQAELQLVRHHEKEVDEFRKQHHFGPQEQQVLDDGPVDMNFLTVLERAREVHRRSSELMQSQEYHQGAAAVMESTYAAIARATEKIARHLLATAGTASSGGAAAASAAAAAGRGGGDVGGVGAIAADVPEVTGFQLRCVRLLYEESPSLHEKFLDEVARLRRASVLRRYFHLLTTGSANTASGLYQSGGQPRGEGGAGGGETGMGTRPLEAELNNPAYFFSSLCAWLHQTIVEEQDFLHTFFMSDDAETQTVRRGSHSSAPAHVSVATAAAATAHRAGALVADGERAKADQARQRALLDTVFGGVCKHIRAALDNVLERLGRTASALGSAKGEGEQSDSGHGDAAESKEPAAAPYKGPRGLTGGLTRLFMAATGRAPAGAFRNSGSGSDGSAGASRYAAVTTRAQLETVAASQLQAPLQGVQTCVTLVQLFEYYTATTFAPLLGEGSALTRLVRETAPQQTRELFHRLLRVLSAHLLDSAVGMVQRTAALRRLAASNALSSTAAAAGADGRATAATTDAQSSPPSASSSTYILDFLTSLTYGEETESAANASMSVSLSDSRSEAAASNAKFRQASDGQAQRHSAQDLKRVLAQLILPPSPEVMAYCSILDTVLSDTARQADLLQAIAEQHQQQQQQSGGGLPAEGSSSSSPARLRTEVKGFVCELLQALWAVAQSTQQDATLRGHLDDLCRGILQYNVISQLQCIMERHCEVLDMLCDATASDATADGDAAGVGAGAGGEGRGIVDSGSLQDGVDMRQTLDTLRAESGAAMNGLRRRLLALWEEAIIHYYFPLSTESVVAAALSTTVPNSGAAESAEQQPRHPPSGRDTRRVLKQVVNVYNTVASMGHLPEPVPLLPALCGSEQMHREVGVQITKSVVERVYPAEFAALQRLPPSEELAAVQAEMSPQNLTMLLDFSSSPSAGSLSQM